MRPQLGCTCHDCDEFAQIKSGTSSVGMMQITEDTPPDMLAGAMDLMVHLPDGKTTKISVERSTPMMDVLVQITNINHLQISGYSLQPLAIHGEKKILPFLPNTPIGTLDTQDIRVVPKTTSTLARGGGGGARIGDGAPPQQPFESTFRLKVHLPRNQLYVERVSMQALLRDIMRKMCDEKNLDANKYEFRHPGNLDQVLDLKLRLADYQITEVYAVSKGSQRLTQVFSSSDSIMMAFRKDDERKQPKSGGNSGGGIFNFLKRGKISNGSGSLSSDNRSISPTHSDDSRSVSPPSTKMLPTRELAEKPKPPMRKRRPAPKPPSEQQQQQSINDANSDKDVNVTTRKKDGLTICHSRNSSDSSGYHEASILSDNAANTSLPRKRPQTLITTTSNLGAMKAQSKSTSSLAFSSKSGGRRRRSRQQQQLQQQPQMDAHPDPNPPTQSSAKPSLLDLFKGRNKKKAAPPPPPALPQPQPVIRSSSVTDLDQASPPSAVAVVASPTSKQQQQQQKQQSVAPEEERLCSNTTNLPYNQTTSISDALDDYKLYLNSDRASKSDLTQFESENTDDDEPDDENLDSGPYGFWDTDASNRRQIKINHVDPELASIDFLEDDEDVYSEVFQQLLNKSLGTTQNNECHSLTSDTDDDDDDDNHNVENDPTLPTIEEDLLDSETHSALNSVRSRSVSESHEPSSLSSLSKEPKIIGVVMKKKLGDGSSEESASKCAIDEDSLVQRRRSMTEVSMDGDPVASAQRPSSTTSMDLYTLYLCSNFSSLTNADTKKPTNNEDPTTFASNSPPESIASSLATTLSSNIETDIGNNNIRDEITEEEIDDNEEESAPLSEEPCARAEEVVKPPEVPQNAPTKLQTQTAVVKNNGDTLDATDWEYQLPSPPTAFRDSSPQPSTTTSDEATSSDATAASDIHPSTDSILTSPELFEKLQVIKESQSGVDVQSTKSFDSHRHHPHHQHNEEDVNGDKFISKLSLENLEKRKKLVYNRELATSLKYDDDEADESSKRSSVLSELEDVLSKPAPPVEANRNWNKVKQVVDNFTSAARADRTLPNFKITTYDIPKKKINIFEDDSIRSSVTAPPVMPAPPAPMQRQRVGRPEVQARSSAPQEFNKHRAMTLSRDHQLQRSESFNAWVPSMPVKRSKSQVALKPEPMQRREEPIGAADDYRSRSTLDLTGLQSIEVMKAIRTTLTTAPTTRTITSSTALSSADMVDSAPPKTVLPTVTPEAQPTRRPVSMYETPAINLTSWRDRVPKTVTNTSLNADRISVSHHVANRNHINSNMMNGTTNVTMMNGAGSGNNVSIKVNGSEAISQQSDGNVVIKIQSSGGGSPPTAPKKHNNNVLDVTKRFINHTTAVGYRKPLGNINKVETTRPHSMAFENYQYDASRVPIVRAVELKKPISKDGGGGGGGNTSITQIRPDAGTGGGAVCNGKVNLFENVVLRKATKRNAVERPHTVNLALDPRGDLLESIRNFGGKRGLKTVKV